MSLPRGALDGFVLAAICRESDPEATLRGLVPDVAAVVRQAFETWQEMPSDERRRELARVAATLHRRAQPLRLPRPRAGYVLPTGIRSLFQA